MSGCNSWQPHHPIYDLRLVIADFQTGRAPARGRVSKTQLVWGSTTAVCQIENRKSQIKNFWGSWQTRNALALQASLCGRDTHRLHHFKLRGTRLKHREKPHKLLQVGVIPTPATSLRKKATPISAYFTFTSCYGLASQSRGSDPAARL